MGKHFHQAPFCQKVRYRHPELVSDPGRANGGLTNRAAIVRIERSVRDNALTTRKREGPWSAGTQVAQARMRCQVLDGLRPPASRTPRRRSKRATLFETADWLDPISLLAALKEPASTVRTNATRPVVFSRIEVI
jgi:hypothetical protein